MECLLLLQGKYHCHTVDIVEPKIRIQMSFVVNVENPPKKLLKLSVQKVQLMDVTQHLENALLQSLLI